MTVVSRTGRCPLCRTPTVFSLNVHEDDTWDWSADCCEERVDAEALGLPEPEEPTTVRLMTERARASLARGPQHGDLVGGSSRRFTRNFYAEGHTVFQLPRNHPDRVVFSESQHHRVLEENGYSPKDGGVIEDHPRWGAQNKDFSSEETPEG